MATFSTLSGSRLLWSIQPGDAVSGGFPKGFTTAEIVGYASASSSLQGQVKAWLSSVTDSAASLTAAQASLTALTATIAGGTNEAGASYVLTINQDLLTGTNGNDYFRAVAGNQQGVQDQTTLNSSDIIDGSTGSDTLIVNLNGNYGGGARIKNIETLQIGTNVTTGTAVTFDYNVNAGANEITEATTIVADQINSSEALFVTNILKTGDAIPTLKWDNEAGSTAGVFGASFRSSAVAGDTEVKLVLDDVKAGVFFLGSGSDASVETLRVVSQGSTANTLTSFTNGDGATAVDLVSWSSDGVNDNSALKKVIVEGAQAFGKAATVVTDTTSASFGLTNRIQNGASDLGRDSTQSASNLVSLAATVTELDASAATGDTNIRFTSRIDAAEVNVTYKGGKGNDYVEFQQGNISATGGDGNDTFAFINAQNNSTLTTADTIVGGAGTDTIQMGVNGVGTYNLDTTEFNNKTGIDVLDLRGNTNTVRLADAFVGAADAGLTVRTDKIVQTSDTSTANSSTATANNFLENNSVNTITLTALAANRAVEFIGGSGSDRIVVNEVSLNSNVKLDGGTNESINNGRFDTITVQDSAVLSRGDLANVKNFEGIVLVKSDQNSTRQYTIEVTEAFLNANSKVLQIGTTAAANQNPLNLGDTVTIDVSDLLVSSNAATKTTGYDRKIDVTSLKAVNATVNFTANGSTISETTLQALGLVTTTADTNQASVLASAAQAVSNIGGAAPVAPVTLSNTAEIITANATALTGGTGTADTLTVTNAGTVTVGSQTTALETLVLANGTNTVTFAQAGFTSVTGGTGADTVNLGPLVASTSVSLGGGDDVLNLDGTRTGSLVGGDGQDTLALSGNADLKSATVSGFETLNVGTNTLTLTAAQFAGFTSGVNGTGRITFSNSADVTHNVGTAALYQLAAGGQSFTGNAAVDYGVIGGAGNDTISLTAVTAADTVNGGAGVDTLVIRNDVVAGAAVIVNQLSNIEVINLTTAQTAANLLTLTLTSDVTATSGVGSLAVNINGGASQVAVTYGGTSTVGASITGSAGADTITGGAQADTIVGGAGADVIRTSNGADRWTGGDGADTFTLTSNQNTFGTGVKVITDFTAGTDKLAFDITTATAFATRSAIGTVLTADGGVGIIQAALNTSQITTDVSAAAAANIALIIFNSSTGKAEVWFDTDWATTADRVQIATLDNIVSLAGVTSIAGGDLTLS